jgi:hypothetical protein
MSPRRSIDQSDTPRPAAAPPDFQKGAPRQVRRQVRPRPAAGPPRVRRAARAVAGGRGDRPEDASVERRRPSPTAPAEFAHGRLRDHPECDGRRERCRAPCSSRSCDGSIICGQSRRRSRHEERRRKPHNAILAQRDGLARAVRSLPHGAQDAMIGLRNPANGESRLRNDGPDHLAGLHAARPRAGNSQVRQSANTCSEVASWSSRWWRSV